MTRPAEDEDVVLEEGITVELTQLLVLVKKDPMMQVPKRVFAHELPLLQATFGEDNVETKEEETVEVSNFTVDGEYGRLAALYNTKDSKTMFEVYGNSPRQLAEELGLPWSNNRGARVVAKAAQNLEIGEGEDAGAGQAPVTKITRKQAGQAKAKAKPKPAPAIKAPKTVGKKKA